MRKGGFRSRNIYKGFNVAGMHVIKQADVDTVVQSNGGLCVRSVSVSVVLLITNEIE